MNRLINPSRSLLLLLVAALAPLGLSALSPLPVGEGVRIGRLDNGLTYYIKATKVQTDVAGLYLVQNVGSLMEQDNQRGLAHFLEHMAFNGSENFPGQIDRFLTSHNITGYNAYTAQDETIYNIDNVPTSDPALLDSCLLVMRDWCHFLSFPDKGIEKERGIVLEEWRTRRDAVARAREKIVGVLYNGSRYSTRETIGDLSVLESFDRESLVAYYDRWYRPDLQAVVVVGDFDSERVESFIRERFASIPTPQNPEPRPQYTISDHPQPSYVKVVDSELGGVTMEFSQRFPKPAQAENGQELIRRVVVRDLFNRMVNARLAQLTTGHDQTLYGCSMEFAELLRGYNALTISITPYPGRDFRGVSNVFQVWETLRKLGFTTYEFEQQRKQMLRQVEGLEQSADRAGYQVYATLYQNHYLNSTPIVEPAQRGELMRKALQSLDANQINEWMRSWALSDDNRVFIVSGNDSQYEYLSLDDILGAQQDVIDGELVQPTFADDATTLIDFELKPAKVLSERRLPIGDALEWSFANGAKVCFKSTDQGSGRFRVQAISDGGLSLIDDCDIASANAVEPLAFSSGVYKTDRSAMIDLMQNHDMEVNFRLQSRREMISADALSADGDRLFELLYLGIVHPRFDQAEFDRYINELHISLQSRRPTDLDLIADTIRRLSVRSTSRNPEVDGAYIESISLDRVKQIFAERFNNPSDFVFYIVGDLSVAEAKGYAAKYIGTLPRGAKRRPERFREYESVAIKEDLKRTFHATMEDKMAMVDISYSNNQKLDRKQAMAFWMVGVVLNSRCTDQLRERMGGTYNVQVEATYNEMGDPRQWLRFNYQTSTPKLEQMLQATYKELEDLLRDGVTQADIESIVGAQKRRLESQRRNSAFWLNALFSFKSRGEDITRADYHTSLLDGLTPEDVKKAAHDFYKSARHIELIVRAAEVAQKVENLKVR